MGSTSTTLGPYSVTAKIGEGAMDEVYQARDTTLNRNVAMKVLSEAFSSEPDPPHDSSASSALQPAHPAGHGG